MNMKKIILAATTLILACTLSTGFAAPSQDLNIQSEKVYLNKNETNAIKFNNKNGRYSVVGMYYTKKTKTLGTWRGKKCQAQGKSQLSCKFKSSHRQKGIITFVVNSDGTLKSSIKFQHQKLPSKKHTWHIAN